MSQLLHSENFAAADIWMRDALLTTARGTTIGSIAILGILVRYSRETSVVCSLSQRPGLVRAPIHEHYSCVPVFRRGFPSLKRRHAAGFRTYRTNRRTRASDFP